MLLLQTYAKRIIFFGFVISCSLTIASAMTDAPMTDDAKVSQGAKASQAPDVKNVVIFDQGPKFYDSVAARVAMLQQEKIKDEVIVTTVAQEILNQKINVNEMYWGYGNNPKVSTYLYIAAGEGNLLVIKILLAAGDKRIDQLNAYQESALSIALQKREYAVATYLVCEAGASVDTAPRILHYAAAQGLDKVVAKLLEKWGKDKFTQAANTNGGGYDLPIEHAEYSARCFAVSAERQTGCVHVIEILKPYTDDSLRRKPEKKGCDSGCHCNFSAA